jgi:hypothetical protein
MGDRAPRYGAIWTLVLLLSAASGWGFRKLGLPVYGAVPLGLVVGYVLVMAFNALTAPPDRRGSRDPVDPRA